MRYIFKTGLQSVLKNNLLTWLVLGVLLSLGTVFFGYSITFFRYLSFDCSLESPDYSCVLLKDELTASDVALVEQALSQSYKKSDYTVLAYFGEDGYGNPVYLTEKYYHNSAFHSLNKKGGVFPQEYYEKGETVSLAEVDVLVNKIIDTEIVQLNIADVPQSTAVGHIIVRFNRPLSQKTYDAVSQIFGQDADGFEIMGLPASTPSVSGEAFIVLNIAFALLIIIIIAFAVYWINLKSQNYYKTLHLLGYGRLKSLLPMLGICFLSVLAVSAMGTAVFYLTFYLSKTAYFIGAFYATDYLIIVAIETVFIVTATFLSQLKAVRKVG